MIFMTQSSGVQGRKKNVKSAKLRGDRRNLRHVFFVLLLSCILFLSGGMNDVEHYKSRVDVFIERYRDCLSRLKSSLPNAVIYVNAVFPVSEKKLAKQSVFQYVDLYNQGLEQLCREMDVFYIDNSFILRRNPDYFDQDGQHPISRFYPLWLTYFADIAGLSDDDE